MPKIVNKDFNVADTSILSILKHYLMYLRMPVLDFAEGPKFKYLFELFCLHTLGRLEVMVDLKYPRVYKVYARIKNSLAFRYNHYKNQINKKRNKGQNSSLS